ncbi:unnamed protein product [Lupinus luteus]|uniref:Uncharacterized protein n=1 Tax=Lupinus luteus TaxID=3873 RepID=A0AAV1YDJ2_LUPLU
MDILSLFVIQTQLQNYKFFAYPVHLTLVMLDDFKQLAAICRLVQQTSSNLGQTMKFPGTFFFFCLKLSAFEKNVGHQYEVKIYLRGQFYFYFFTDSHNSCLH